MNPPMHPVRSLAVLLAVLGGVVPALAGTVPYGESFESYPIGYAITNATGWSGGTPGADATVTNPATALAALTAYTNAGNGYPLPGEAHAKVLLLSPGLTNSVNSATGGVVITDLLAMPSPATETPGGSSNYQFACWVNMSSQLVVWCRDVAGGSNAWCALSGTSLATGAWARITVTRDFASSRYTVALNGGAALTDAKGWSAASGGSQPGPWFDMAQTNGYASRFRAEGAAVAYLDDLVFTNRAVNYGGTNFNEAIANNGSMAAPITLTLFGDTFVNTTYSPGTHFSTSGVPAGLAVALSYLNPTQVVVSLTGNAAPHTAAASTGAMGLTLGNAIFTLGRAADVAGRSRTNLVVNFNDPPVVDYAPTVFTEDGNNNGAVGNTIAVTLTGGALFSNVSPFVENTHYTVSGVPAGMSFSLTRDNATNLTATLGGAATAHANSNDTAIAFTLLNAAFEAVAVADVVGASTNLAVDFADAPTLNYTTTNFAETAANHGAVSGGTISLVAKQFAGAVGTNYVAGGQISVQNVPGGLTLSIVKDSASQATLSFNGFATNHAAANSIANLSVAFLDGAFVGGNAAGVVGRSNTGLHVTFVDQPVLSYTPATFSEATANNGTIGNDVVIGLTGETFTNASFSPGVHYTTSGVPAGLTFSLTRNSATQLTASVTGTATAHANANDTNMTLTFLTAAFTTVAPADITDSSKTLAFDFKDQPVIGYSRTVFSELSNGRINNTDPMVITLGGDAFTGSDGDEFYAAGKVTAANVPPGLTPVLTRTSATTLSAMLAGAATANADANDVNNLTLVFQNSAIAGAQAAQVVNYSNGTLQVDFNDFAVAINPVPYQESFESYGDGFALVGTNGWQSEDVFGGTVTTTAAIVSALTDRFATFPLTTNHAKVLCMTAELTDEIKSGAGGKVYTDTMLFITPRASDPAGSDSYQFAFYVNTNRQPVVWHRDVSGAPTNRWTVLTGAPEVATGAWHRITVVQDYAAGKYQLCLDGNGPLANPTSGNDWFSMVGTTNNYLSRLRVLGADAVVPSYLDDLTVSTRVPEFLRPGTVFMFR